MNNRKICKSPKDNVQIHSTKAYFDSCRNKSKASTLMYH